MARVYPFEAIPVEVRKRIQDRNSKWAASPTALDWVEDFYPDVAAKVKTCKTFYDPAESRTRPDKWKAVTHSCYKIPWCIPCSHAAGTARAWEAMSKFRQVTPPDQVRRVIPLTLTTLVLPNQEGYAIAASKDINRFAKVVVDFVHEVYDAEKGELGWIMSYQDFGERAFKKRHPHWHATLNGSRWRDGKMEPVPRLELRGRAHARVAAAWDNALRTCFPGADKGNFRLEEPAVDKGAFYKWLKYETRELVDLRKLAYERKTATATRSHYHDGHERTRFHGAEFWQGLEEYRKRLRPERPNSLHREYGYMRCETRKKLMIELRFSGDPHDTETCSCNECDEWFGVPELRGYAMGWELAEHEWDPPMGG